MKKSILALTAAVALIFVACKENPYIAGPGASNDQIPDSIPVLMPDTNGTEISIDSAIIICNSLAVNAETSELYKLSGVVSRNITSPSAVPGSYTNINIDLKDPVSGKTIACYYTNNLYNRPFRSTAQVPLVGSKITVLGPLTNYNKNASATTGTPELKNGFIVRIDSMVKAETIHATCAEAKEAALALENNTASKDIYIIECYVQSDGYNASISKGQQIFWVDDVKNGSKVFEAYYCDVPNGEAVPIGAKVRLTGNILRYNTTPEMKNGKVEILELPEAE